MGQRKIFWITLSLFNLCIVALLGIILRSKIVFSLPFLDYKNLLNAHSHYAFSGWVGLCFMTLLIYNLLPENIYQKKIYQWILWIVQISSFGMLIAFPLQGYAGVSIFFSTLYIFISYVFGWVFIKDLLKSKTNKAIRLLSIASIASLAISAIGPFGLAYILISKSGDASLYRDCIYTFLHFQYNGFFTLAVFTLFFNELEKRAMIFQKSIWKFSVFLVLSIVPSLFLSLLWHGQSVFYLMAFLGSLFILAAMVYFIQFLRSFDQNKFLPFKLAQTLLHFALLSFLLKMLLMVGTLIPALGNAVYGDRPVIIGFLHLVFLAFVTFFIFSHLLQNNYFTKWNGSISKTPFIVFTIGVLSNEILLMLQGLQILFQSNSYMYNWWLWGVSIVLFIGALLIYKERLSISKKKSHNHYGSEEITDY